MLGPGSYPNDSPEYEDQGSALYNQSDDVCRNIFVWGRSIAW